MSELKRNWFKGSYSDKQRRAKMAWSYLNNSDKSAKFGLFPPTDETNPPSVGERSGDMQGNLPANGSDGEQKQQRLTRITNQSEWFHITYKGAYDEFIAAFDDWQDNTLRTPLKVRRLQDALKSFTPKHRALYAFVKHHPLTTPEDLVAMGFPYYESSRSLSPNPNTVPVAVLTRKATGVVEVRYFDGKSKRRGKPRGMHGVELRWSLLDNHPGNDYNLLINSEFATASPILLHMNPEDYGKTLYCVLRWENNRGVKGDFSIVYSIIVG